MNKKKYIILLTAVIVLIATQLTSCSAEAIYSDWSAYFWEFGNAARADWEEFDLREFVEVPASADMSFHSEPASAAAADPGLGSILVSHPHRETVGADREDVPDPTAKGYVRTDLLLGLDISEAEEVLSAAGTAYSVKTVRNPMKEGMVYGVEYAGIGTADGHYINPALPVTLYVSGEKPRFQSSPGENTVYITFDDGPGGKGTLELLDILDSYGVKATFFLLGDAVKKDLSVTKEIYTRGHDVACHSMSHNYKAIYSSAAALMFEVDEWTALMESLGVDFNEMPKMFRYPGGSVSQYLTGAKREAMNKAFAERDFRVYDWNVVVNDALLFQCPEGMSYYSYIVENFLATYTAAKAEDDPIIILFHDNVPETRAVLPWIIEYLMDDGCAFAPLSALGSQWTFADR